MAQYYYLVASFPMLFFDSERLPALDSFLALCGEHLAPRDFRIVAAASIDSLDHAGPSCGVLARFRTWETALRNELVRIRAKARAVEAEDYLREGLQIVSAAAVARSAAAQEVPLAAEQLLDRSRWDYLDEVETGHYFDLERVVVYYLRLQILHRKAQFEAAAGKAAFDDIYGGVTRGITDPVRQGAPDQGES